MKKNWKEVKINNREPFEGNIRDAQCAGDVTEIRSCRNSSSKPVKPNLKPLDQ